MMDTAAGRPAEPGSSKPEESAGLAARALAHDFNNLLAAIAGHASYLRMITEPGSEADQTAATIEMAAVRAKGLAMQLHQLGNQLASGKAPAISPRESFAPVDLHAVVREVVATLCTGQANPVRFSTTLAAAPPLVLGDAGQLHQLVMNLVVNACEAMGAAGGAIAIETSAGDGCLQLNVRDSGPGIPAEHRTRIFDVSYSTKSTGGGMGLDIVRRVAQNHGAAIELGDNQPCGTVFRLRFPSAAKA